MVVLKFGGTSVADAEAIRRVVSIVGARPGPRTVVVSALAGVTDVLLDLADVAARDGVAAIQELDSLVAQQHAVAAEVRDTKTRQVLAAAVDGIARGATQAIQAIAASNDASPQLVDKLLASGELWSSRIVAAFLTDAGIAVQWVDARHVVRTDGRHQQATPDLAATDKVVTRVVRSALALDRVVILGGF